MREELIKLIKEEEGFRAKPYLCPAKRWTIGYGSTLYEDGTPVKETDRPIDEARALSALEAHLNRRVYPVIDMSVQVQLTSNQFDAITSFIYNVGGGNFQKSTLLRKLNAGDYVGAADEFRKWNTSNGKVLNGLVRRREKERALFLKP
jgi:lysozyme